MAEGRRLILAATAFMEEEGVDVSAMTAKAEELRNGGATVIFVAMDGIVAGLFAMRFPSRRRRPRP